MLSGFLSRAGISLAAEDTWTYKANMPTARTFVSGSVVDEKIYVIGGAPSPSSLTSAVEMYDPTVDKWTRMANMPSARCGHATCTFDGKIYVFGGTSPDMWSTAKKNVYVYDPQTDTWTQKADMPHANAFCGIVVVDDIIYLIGGCPIESSPPVSTVMAYNPITESWTQKADMPTARTSLSACVLDGKIYATGGCTEDWRVFSYKHVEIYDPSTDTWTRKSDMPTPRWALGTCVVDGKIYAIGGGLGTAALTANEVYVPITDTWTTKSPMQQKRFGHFGASIGDRIYAIGGSAPGTLSTVEEYDTGLGVPSPDFNGDSKVDLEDFSILAQHWGQNESSVDIGPTPFGDDIVDVRDVAVLADYWLKEVLPVSLLAYWKLDETEGTTAHDSAGNHDGALLTDNPLWRPLDGQVDGALELDGIDDCVTTPLSLNPAAGPFSAFAWAKGGGPGQVVISQSAGMDWLLADAEGKLMTMLRRSSFTPTLASGYVITDGDWHHIGVVWDGSHRHLYVDGTEVAEDTADLAYLRASNGNLYIGAGNTRDPASFFSGLIDDIRIYNRATVP